MRFKAVIFDLDDTLYNEFDFVRGGYKAVADYLAEKYGCENNIIFSDMLSYYKNNGRNRLFDYIVKKNNIIEEGIVKKMLEIYRTHAPSIKLYDDAVFLINKLKGLKIKTGVITDGIRSVQQSKINSLCLEGIMDNIIFTCELKPGNSKPSIAPFKLMSEFLGVRCDDCCYVGDNPFKDFEGPNKLNMGSVRLSKGMYKDFNGNGYSKAMFTVTSLKDVLSI